MEYKADIDRITALKVRHMCCDAYEKKLQKKLLQHEGVYSVEMNREKSLVLVRGKVDPNSLINIVARTGKHAEVVCSNTNTNTNTKCCSSCQESQHKCEDYVPPSVDDEYHYMRSRSWRSPMYHQPESAPSFGHHGGLGTPFGHQPRRFPPPPPGPGPGYGFRQGFNGYGY